MKGRANSLKHTEHKTFSDVSSSYDVQHRFECISQLGEGKIQILYYLNKAFHINLRVEFNNSIHAISLIYKINLESRINLHKFPCFVVVVFFNSPPPPFFTLMATNVLRLQITLCILCSLVERLQVNSAPD